MVNIRVLLPLFFKKLQNVLKINGPLILFSYYIFIFVFVNNVL